MALPAPLHPSHATADDVLAEFASGEHSGQVLLVAKNDPNLAAAVASGDVILPGPLGTPAPVPGGHDTSTGGHSTMASAAPPDSI